MTMGEKIRRLRKEKGMTQEELGNEVGIQKAAINKYETGIVVNLKRGRLERIAKVLGVNPVWLMDDDADWPPVKSVRAMMMSGVDHLEDSDFKKMVKESNEAKELGELYLSLSPTNRAAVRKYAAFLKDQEEEND
jgi:transcriptional regulator with XRE-family HTH domain